MQDAAIVVKSGETELSRKQCAHMAPGEMEHVILPRKQLDACGGELTVSVEEASK